MTQELSSNDTQAILRQRALLLSAENLPQKKAGNLITIAQFEINDEKYGINIQYVNHVCALKDITFLPCVPSFLLGVVNIHGKIIPVIDLIKLFNLTEKSTHIVGCILILQLENIYLGIVTDNINEVTTICTDDLQSSLPTLTGVHADYLQGVTADRIAILDAVKLLSDNKLVIEEQV